MKAHRPSRREMLGALAGAATATLGWPAHAASTANRPNFVFVLIDDQAWNAMGHCGRFPFLQTPNMDRLEREGASFDNAFVTTSLCSPSRACFLTGCHAHRHGVRRNEERDPDPDIETFPQALQQAGYETAFVGKWHMAPKASPRPGFDYWLSFRGQGKYIDPELNENGRDFQQDGYMTDILTEYATRWLEQPREKPFCLLLWHKAVHGPFTPAARHADAFPDAVMPEPANFDDTFEDKPEWIRQTFAYGARREQWAASEGKPVPDSIPPGEWHGQNRGQLDYMRTLLAVDESLGALLDTLEETGQLDNTVVVFSSDNGFFLGEHRRGDKRLMYEESIRIPLLVRYPHMVEPGAHLPQMALSIDVAPTFLDLAGARTPKTVQGRSLVPLLAGKRNVRWRDAFLYSYFQEGWLPGIPTMLGARTDRWKYIHYPDLPDEIDELYDLEADPYEMHNLSQQPESEEQLAHMRRVYEKLLKEMDYTDKEPTPHASVPVQLAVQYTFADCAGATVEDMSGNGVNGVLRNAEAVSGPHGPAMQCAGNSVVEVPEAPEAFSPGMKPFTVGAWCLANKPEGILVSLGGQTHGFTLGLRNGLPYFAVTAGGNPSQVTGSEAVPMGKWVHLAGMLTKDCELRVYLDGKLMGKAQGTQFIPARPNEGLTVGADVGTPVGDYATPLHWDGLIADFRLYWGELRPRHLRRWAKE